MSFETFIPFIHEGQVVQTDDPDQMGRVKVWVQALDGEAYDIDSLPWCDYAPPLFGFTGDLPAGTGNVNPSETAYGFWAVPKMGATVYVFFLAGDPNRRVFFANSIRLHRNRSLPAGRNTDLKGNVGPFGDGGDTSGNLYQIEPAFSNLRQHFNGDMKSSESLTRGVNERQVAQPTFDKDGTEGYSKTPLVTEKYLDSQTYCWVTPGRHAIIFQDDPRWSRLRMKTAEGHQIIFDDANERIYISTAKGANWIEMDLDGHINIFADDSISIRSGKDINFFADGSINLEAGKAINIKADTQGIAMSAKTDVTITAAARFMVSACKDIHFSGDQGMRITLGQSMDLKTGQDITLTAGRQIDMGSSSNLTMKGSRIDLNGPTPRTAQEAICPPQATGPTVVPGHEPWRRPASSLIRNKNWKA